MRIMGSKQVLLCQIYLQIEPPPQPSPGLPGEGEEERFQACFPLFSLSWYAGGGLGRGPSVSASNSSLITVNCSHHSPGGSDAEARGSMRSVDHHLRRVRGGHAGWGQ